jgi:hypothetical protein
MGFGHVLAHGWLVQNGHSLPCLYQSLVSALG